MTINGAITQLVMMTENSMMPNIFRPALNKVIETISELEPEPHWIPCSERLPEEDHRLGGSGKQFSSNVLVSIVNRSDEDSWVDISHTIDGEWVLELSRDCKVIAWQPLPSPYQEEQ